MKTFVRITIAAMLVSLVCASAEAAITPVTNGSGVRAYFGSQGTGYMAADPSTIFTPASPVGPYPAGVGIPLPNLPAPPVPLMYPAVSGYNFNGGTGYTFNFNDLAGTNAFTAATTTINHIYNPGGSLVSDASIDFPIWRFYQGPSAPSYAYEQINFVSQYLVSTSLGGSTPSIPLFITGQISPGGTPFAQFDAAITYTWADVDASGNVTGPATNLGTLYYSWLQTNSAPIFQTILSTGALNPTPLGSTAGVLELTGYAYVTGDPFDITISSLPVPEPSTLALLGAGALSLVGYWWRRRRQAA